MHERLWAVGDLGADCRLQIADGRRDSPGGSVTIVSRAVFVLLKNERDGEDRSTETQLHLRVQAHMIDSVVSTMRYLGLISFPLWIYFSSGGCFIFFFSLLLLLFSPESSEVTSESRCKPGTAW